MSELTMFFVAPRADLPSQKLNEGVPAAFPSLQCNFVDEVKVASLENVLTGRDPAEAIRELTHRCVYSHAESGISVLQLSDPLVKALAALTSKSAVEPAKQWLAAGEWGGFGRRAGDLRDLADTLAEIGKLAATAQAPDHGLFFWACP